MIDSRQVDFVAPDDLPSAVVQALAKQKAIEEFGEYDLVQVDLIEKLQED
jgi:hypothetical protein